MARPGHTPQFVVLEEAITVLFCLIDNAYTTLNPKRRRYASLKRLSDSEVTTLALFQQLRGIESQRSFLRDAGRFFSHPFPGTLGIHPSSFHRRIRKLRRYLASPDLVHGFASLSDATMSCVGPVAFRKRVSCPQEHPGVDLCEIPHADFGESTF
jgi:hypothetical protein